MEIFKPASQILEKSNSVVTNQTNKQSTNEAKESQTKDNIVKEQDLTKEETIQKSKEITKKLNFQMEKLDTNVRFNYNETINAFIIEVQDIKTGKVIRQLPSKEALKISENFHESLGLLFNKEG